MLLRELVGQEHAVSLLTRAVQHDRTAHAYLFDGPEGVGKRSAGVGLAIALICRQSPGQGCGVCDACRRILAGQHPDVRVFAPRKADYVVDQIREDIIPLGSERPHEAPARVLVLDEADRLNVESGNCLLKTLEEPAAHTHFVLVTAAPERLLPTIRSRTQRVRFRAVAGASLTELLVRRGLPRERAELLSAVADGSVARALSFAEGDAETALWQSVTELRRAAASGEVGALFEVAAPFKPKERREELGEVARLLGRFYRDALATAVGAPELVLLRERQAEIDAVARSAAGHQALLPLRRALGAVIETETSLAANINPVTALEHLLLRVRGLERGAAS